MRTVIIGAAIIMFTLVSGYSKAREQVKYGLQKDYYESGAIKSEAHYLNGKANGPAKIYYESGELEIEVNYVDDRWHGVAKKYFKSGQLQDESVWVDGKLHDYSKEYYEDGTLRLEGVYRTTEDRKLDSVGELKRYYETGELNSTWTIKDNKPIGLSRDYHKNGKIYFEQYHESDRRVRDFKAYDENGQMTEYIEWQIKLNDSDKWVKHGRHQLWDENGKLLMDQTYFNGELINTKK